MADTTSLGPYLDDATSDDVAVIVMALAGAAAQIAEQIRHPQTALDAAAGDTNADGDTQKKLDVIADFIIEDALRDTAAMSYLSEEREQAVALGDGGLIVACDPLDGSSNIGVNVSVGTIFSVLPAAGGELQPGRAQLAAGFFVYGPQTTLLISVGAGTASFRMDSDGVFHLIDGQISIPETATEFAVNASNQRHWPAAVQRYIDECLAGSAGNRDHDFNMRWVASLVAETWRVNAAAGCFYIWMMHAPGMRRAACAWSMKLPLLPCWSNRRAVLPAMAGCPFLMSFRANCISACRWCLVRQQRCAGLRRIIVERRDRPARPAERLQGHFHNRDNAG